MENLFTYGTLQDEQVQRYVFGRTLEGRPDALPNHKWFENAILEKYALVRPTGNPDDFVNGIVYRLSIKDLLRADVYETSAYRRELFTLKSGIRAWVYVDNSP